MAIPATGAISFENLRSEFKRTSLGSISFNELYRGGSFVPNEVFYHNNQIPAGGATIRASNFRSTTKGADRPDNSDGPYFPTERIYTLAELPAGVDRIRIIMAGGGGGAKVVVAGGTATEMWTAGGGGGVAVGYISGFNNIANAYGGRSNVRIRFRGPTAGNSWVATSNIYQCDVVSCSV